MSITSEVTHRQSLSLAGTLAVTGAVTFSGAVSVGSTLAVTGAATLASTLAVTGAVTLSSTLAVTGATTCAALTASGLITANGGITLGASDTLTVPATGIVNVATGGQIQANGTQASHIADASVAHDVNSTFSDTEVEAALDALGGKINAILVVLEGIGATATS